MYVFFGSVKRGVGFTIFLPRYVHGYIIRDIVKSKRLSLGSWPGACHCAFDLPLARPARKPEGGNDNRTMLHSHLFLSTKPSAVILCSVSVFDGDKQSRRSSFRLDSERVNGLESGEKTNILYTYIYTYIYIYAFKKTQLQIHNICMYIYIYIYIYMYIHIIFTWH